MSTWHNINVPEDVEVNNDDDTLEIYIGDDYGGAIYVSVPISFVKKALDESDTKAI